MPRFYLPYPLNALQTVELTENVVRHLHVLRVRMNEEVVLFDGSGKAYPSRIVLLEKRRAVAEILREEVADNESALKITLVQSVSGGERMDFTVQKSVELGVARIQPVISERCTVRLSGERAEKRVARWQEIAVSACEQSGRNIVPKVMPIISYQEALKQMPSETTKLLMSLNRARKLGEIKPLSEELVFMVGPEGGWTEQEEKEAFETGFLSVTLGKRVLRTETAALAAISAMQTLWGDFAY